MANAGDKPCMNWQAANLATESRRFRQHYDFTFNGPLATKTEGQKVNYLMTYIGDKDREIYETFRRERHSVGSVRQIHAICRTYEKPHPCDGIVQLQKTRCRRKVRQLCYRPTHPHERLPTTWRNFEFRWKCFRLFDG